MNLGALNWLQNNIFYDAFYAADLSAELPFCHCGDGKSPLTSLLNHGGAGRGNIISYLVFPRTLAKWKLKP